MFETQNSQITSLKNNSTVDIPKNTNLVKKLVMIKNELVKLNFMG